MAVNRELNCNEQKAGGPNARRLELLQNVMYQIGSGVRNSVVVFPENDIYDDHLQLTFAIEWRSPRGLLVIPNLKEGSSRRAHVKQFRIAKFI